MNIVITCGPSYEPVDQVRRLTNFSTGRLGTVLANAFHDHGHTVFCFKGEGATVQERLRMASVFSFSTNEDLSQQLAGLASRHSVDAVFHAAALCDYRVVEVRDSQEQVVVAGKIPTRQGRLSIILEPAPKLLPRLRDWFPQARIVGWKYELDGAQREAVAKAWRQIEECRTEACVINGAAYGNGYGLCLPPDQVIQCPDLGALTRQLHLLAGAGVRL